MKKLNLKTKKKSSRRLGITTETLRNLSSPETMEQLVAVMGGKGTTTDDSADTSRG